MPPQRRIFRRRAGHVQREGLSRLVFDRLDLLMLLVSHYWLYFPSAKTKWLLDCAVLFGDPGTFNNGWARRVRTWRVSFLVAAAFEAVRHEFGVVPATPDMGDLRVGLGRSEREICERIALAGPNALPEGLVMKVHRLHLPWRERLRAIRRFLWPHPGFVVSRTGLRHGRPDPFQRFAFGARRLAKALRLRT